MTRTPLTRTPLTPAALTVGPTTPAPLTGSGLVHVTVASATRRVDLALPGSVPLAELVPELARSLGVLDVDTAHGGYRLVLPDGRRLGPEAGLVGQGVGDGSFLTLAVAAEEPPPQVYDDAVEAMADAVTAELAPWHPEHGARAGVAVGGLCSMLGAGALLLEHRAGWAWPSAALVAVVLLSVAVRLCRAARPAWVPVAMAWLAVTYAAACGLLLAWPAGGDEAALAAAPPDLAARRGLLLAAVGGAVLLASGVGLVALTVECRMPLLPAAALGAIDLAAGLVVRTTGWDAALVLTVALVGAVLAGSAFPRLALVVTAADRRAALPDDQTEPAAVDAVQVATDARIAHQILMAMTATVGLLLVSVAPFAVSLGRWGALLCLAASAVVMLRARRHRAVGEVLAGVGLGVLALVAAAVAALVLHPSWRPAVTVGLVAAGVLVLAATTLSATGSVQRSRIGDLLESAATLALLPLLVLASGAFAAVQG
jgi:type VII secretion integral membrane protein EccD